MHGEVLSEFSGFSAMFASQSGIALTSAFDPQQTFRHKAPGGRYIRSNLRLTAENERAVSHEQTFSHFARGRSFLPRFANRDPCGRSNRENRYA
jgi:hypothetical protein